MWGLVPIEGRRCHIHDKRGRAEGAAGEGLGRTARRGRGGRKAGEVLTAAGVDFSALVPASLLPFRGGDACPRPAGQTPNPPSHPDPPTPPIRAGPRVLPIPFSPPNVSTFASPASTCG